MSFGTRLQALRRENGITQEAFAQQLQVSRQAVSKWESSRGYPETEKLLYICRYYGVGLDALFQDELPPAQPAAREDSAPPAPAPDLERRSLKQAFGNFFTNLSPADQAMFSAGVLLLAGFLLVLFCITLSKGASNEMVLQLIWSGLLVVFVIGEAVTVGLSSIWFAAGSLAALLCALLDGPLYLQIALFLAVSALCLLAFRPLADKYLNSRVEATNADRVIGREAVVTERIENLSGSGAVRVGGMIWSARSENDSPIPAGAQVRVLRIEGVKVYVEQL